jgi:molybdopterin-guanine dinucleotide biosynthesis protein A
VAAGRLRPSYVFDDAVVLRLDEGALLACAALRAADPTLESLVNVNDPGDYEAARSRPAPEVTVECRGVPRLGAVSGTVRAATVGAAADAIGLTLDGHVLASVSGEPPDRDPELPLVPGDTVTFVPGRKSS